MTDAHHSAMQRQPAEVLYADDIDKLVRSDRHPVPPGWQMSPIAVEKFIAGDENLKIKRKFVAKSGVVNRVMISLCTDRGCLLMGEPGTAKSWLSELLAAAISGTSALTIQGGTVSTISQMLYTWNEAMVKQHGPVPEALVPSPLFKAMRDGKLLRFEELTRCPQLLQDAILTILSDRFISVPELAGEQGLLYSSPGFNIISTANNVDEGLFEMSAALKRRMSFELIRPIARIQDEIEVVVHEVSKRINQSGIDMPVPEEVIEVLVTAFHELRSGKSIEGRNTDRLAGSSMSTAEAVSVAHAMCVHAYYYRNGRLDGGHLIPFLMGSALKDVAEDRRRLFHYFDTEGMRKTGEHWKKACEKRSLILQ